MKITLEMQKWIELAIEKECEQSYSQTGGKCVVDKVKQATLKDLRSRKDDIVSIAFRMMATGTQQQNDEATWDSLGAGFIEVEPDYEE